MVPFESKSRKNVNFLDFRGAWPPAGAPPTTARETDGRATSWRVHRYPSRWDRATVPARTTDFPPNCQLEGGLCPRVWPRMWQAYVPTGPAGFVFRWKPLS